MRWVHVAVGTLAALVTAASVPALGDAGVAAGRELVPVLRRAAPEVEDFEPLPRASVVVAADGRRIGRFSTPDPRRPVEVEELPGHVIAAVLAAEDVRFFHHPAIDLRAVARAAMANLRGKRQGGSTITQQLAKLNVVGTDASLERKMREAAVAAELEHRYTKVELLEQYLDQVYFGDGAHGLGAAARAYFGVDAAQLTAAQAATLAGKIRAPDALDPDERPDAVVARRNRVLAEMHAQGWLGVDEYHTARGADLDTTTAKRGAEPDSPAPHFVEFVRRQALALDALGPDRASRRDRLFTGGLRIETTLDLDASRAAEATAQQLVGPTGATTGIAAVVPADGAIRILLGGVDHSQKFDAATQARRQVGSAFKPFVALAAIQAGIHPATRLPGTSPMEFTHHSETFEVKNFADASYAEPLTVEDALVHSVNTAYMTLGLQVGPANVVRAARAAGIDADLDAVPAVALGGIAPGLTPLTVAAAYATFAAGGIHASPYAITRITDPTGRVLYQHEPQVKRTIPATHVGLLNTMLRDVIRSGTGQRAQLPWDTAGKTGTSSDNRDGWFVGYTTHLATAVWIGHLDNQPVPGLTGGSLPAELFRHAMLAGHDQSHPPTPLPLASAAQAGLQEPSTTSATPHPADGDRQHDRENGDGDEGGGNGNGNRGKGRD